MQGRSVFCVPMRLNDDFDILIQRDQEPKQALDRELPEVAAQHFGDVGLRDAEHFTSLNLFQAPLLHDAVDLEHELRLDQVLLGVGHADVLEHVTAADFISLFTHDFLALAICSASRKRWFTRSMSRRGVSRAVLDFFWKACSTYTVPAYRRV